MNSYDYHYPDLTFVIVKGELHDTFLCTTFDFFILLYTSITIRLLFHLKTVFFVFTHWHYI